LANIFTEQLISDASVMAIPQGLEIGIRLPWYRSLPLSTVEIAELRLDGAIVPEAAISLQVNEQRHAASELREQIHDWWYVLDRGRLLARVDGLAPGPMHEIELSVNLYPPYIPGLKWVVKSKKILATS
jgi:hypothetical protein